MGDTGVESKLVLNGLAKSKVRFYSTLNSDVGKQVVITDKFNPLRIFTGTFDESLNLLYDLPAFTSYQVKMYGLDGETVESNQTFMLKGYDYLEINVGLNKNSFAGIKAIVDQGLEDELIEVGHEFSEDDGYGDNGGKWVVVAKNIDKFYNHSVYIGRKTLLDGNVVTAEFRYLANKVFEAFDAYYGGMPSAMKNAITTRRVQSSLSHVQDTSAVLTINDKKVWWPSWKEVRGQRNCPLSYNGQTYQASITYTEDSALTQFEHYAQNEPTFSYANGQRGTVYFRSYMRQGSMGYGNIAAPCGIAKTTLDGNDYICSFGQNTVPASTALWPHMMIASGPIE